MNPDGTPIVAPVTPPTEPPAADAPPAWAQTLIDQNADLTTRLDSFEDKLTPPAPPVEEPVVVPTEGWKPNSWSDVDSRAEEKAQKIVEDALAARDTAARTASDEANAAAAEVDQFLDTQVTELTTAKSLPAVVNENDPNDPGKLAQRELYGFALSLGTADLKTSFNVLDNLHKSGKSFDFVKMELVDTNPAALGAQSPVGSSSAGGAAASTKPDYKVIHNMSLDALAARFGQ